MIRHKNWLKPVVSLEMLLVGSAAAIGVVSERFLPLAPLLGIAFLLMRFFADDTASLRTSADPAVLLIAVAGLVSVLVSARRDISIVQLFRLWSGIALFYAVAGWIDSDRRAGLLNAMFITAGIGLSAYAFVSVDWSQWQVPFLPDSILRHLALRVQDEVHPNVLAGSLLLFSVPAAQAVLWHRVGRGSVFGLAFSIIGLAVMCGVLVVTQSRGALLALAAAFLLLVAFRYRWGWLVLLIPPVLAVWAFSALGSDRVLDLVFGGQLSSGLQARMEIWARAIFMIQDFPYTGIGMGLFPDVVVKIYGYSWGASNPVLHAHNLFLQVGVDLGIPGLIAWLAVLITGLATSWRAYRAGKLSGNVLSSGLGAGLFAAQLAVIVHGLLDAVMWGLVRTSPLLWAIWGCSVALNRLADRKKQ